MEFFLSTLFPHEAIRPFPIEHTHRRRWTLNRHTWECCLEMRPFEIFRVNENTIIGSF